MKDKDLSYMKKVSELECALLQAKERVFINFKITKQYYDLEWVGKIVFNFTIFSNTMYLGLYVLYNLLQLCFRNFVLDKFHPLYRYRPHYTIEWNYFSMLDTFLWQFHSMKLTKYCFKCLKIRQQSRGIRFITHCNSISWNFMIAARISCGLVYATPCFVDVCLPLINLVNLVAHQIMMLCTYASNYTICFCCCKVHSKNSV